MCSEEVSAWRPLESIVPTSYDPLKSRSDSLMMILHDIQHAKARESDVEDPRGMRTGLLQLD